MNLELSRLRRQQDYPEIIRRVREAVATDRVTALSDWQVKKWCGLRWRHLFITEAAKDATVRKEARSGASSRRA